jgi:hypothetical protein
MGHCCVVRLTEVQEVVTLVLLFIVVKGVVKREKKNKEIIYSSRLLGTT